MPYDDPTLKKFDSYYQAKSASQRERAENWAVAIGIGERKNRYLLVGLKETERARLDAVEHGGQKKVVRKGGQKTSDRLLALLKNQPHLTQMGMSNALGINRSAIQKQISRLKAAGRLRRVGPDKGGHWEVLK